MDYLITSGIRRVRGDLTGHHTMMIHTRHTIENMTPLVRRIRNIIAHFEVNLLNSRSELGQRELRRFEQRFIDEFQAKGCPEEWGDVRREIRLLLARDNPEVFEINM
ncbi:MAG: Z1 domain-containing protein, partial [Euryarchaeota archaeon]